MDDQCGAMAAALAAAQAEIKDPARTKSGQVRGKRDYRYAGLDDLLQAVRPVLSKHGIAITQAIRRADGLTVLCTELRHSAGGVISSEYPLDWNGSPQDKGSEITYARRYSLEAMVGVAATPDDDGSAATAAADSYGRPPPALRPGESERSALIAQIRSASADLPAGRLDVLKSEYGEGGDPRRWGLDALRGLFEAVQREGSGG